MKRNKTPGPDGFTALFYKITKEEISPILTELIRVIVHEKKIPKTWTEAHITLNPKKQQDLLCMKNYRPISLLNEYMPNMGQQNEVIFI